MADGTLKKRQHAKAIEYRLFGAILAVITLYAFFLNTPLEIFSGLIKIITSRSLLITDYMAVGGVGAMLFNGVLAGAFALGLLIFVDEKPKGSTIMALWMTLGFGFFGKNVFNMWPLSFGVWLYAKAQKESFKNYTLPSLLVATLSPVVSEIAFGGLNVKVGIPLSIVIGIAVGFVFPAVSAFTTRVHDGYNLYNMGFAGGVIAMFLIAGFKAFGIEIETASLWGSGQNFPLALLIYILSGVLIAAGYILGKEQEHPYNLMRIMRTSGKLTSDYYILYKNTVYINMGVLGIFATTLTLILGAEINGPTMGGIITIMAFGCFGKHLKNVASIMAGAVLATYANVLDPTSPSNILAVLFSTGLAPIAGQFGILPGIIAGFIHVNVVYHAGYMSNGLNLYNNGFAAGFVALMLVPLFGAVLKSKRQS